MENELLLTEPVRKAINGVCDFLALRQIDELNKDALQKQYGIEKVDVLMVLGSDLAVIVQIACEAFKEGLSDYLMFCGGIGHSTDNLKGKISRMTGIEVSDLPESEAENYAVIARELYHIPEDKILLESKSTNTSENIRFAMQIFEEKKIDVHSIVLVQDPLLQHRSYATAKAEMDIGGQVISFAPFIPQINEEGDYTVLYGYLWEKERFLQLILGEIWRLRDDENGYGPNGTGYFGHVDIPQDVEEKYEILTLAFAEYSDRCNG